MFKPGTLRKTACLLPILVCLLMARVYGQDPETKDVNARSPNPAAQSRMEKKAQKKKEKQRELTAKAIEVGKKRHEKLQTKEVRKRMKKSKQRAEANNAHKKEFFLKRWFRSKHHTKKR